ncbi:MAG: ABC transporter substrate-binding protein [Chitinivibrionales bacterium]|nr:ABC transporter substrate-binding protein [Chitinivibrionales bacterium]
MKRVLFLSLIGAGLIAYIGCSKKSGNTSGGSGTASDASAITIESGGALDPIANSGAQKGGSLTIPGGTFPKSLNYYLDNSTLTKSVFDLLFEPLITLHSTKNDAIGVLAKSWSISEDKKTFTFTIDPKAQWSDGKPVTAADVQFFYDVIMDAKNQTPLFRVDLKKLARPEIINEKTIRIKTTESHWYTLWSAGLMRAFPRHLWKEANFNKLNFEFTVVNGPYKIAEIKTNHAVTLHRRTDWWGLDKQYSRYKYNFDTINFKFIDDQNKTLETFRSGMFDFYAIYSAQMWTKQTTFDEIKNGWIVKQNIYNKRPIAFQGFAINLRKSQFQDVRVRRALCHLLNRELMNEKLMFNEYFLLNTYFPDLYPDNKNPDAPFYEYNPTKAAKLLDEAGWKVNAKGQREKEGTGLRIGFMNTNNDLRHLNIFIEDLKNVGIEASVEILSQSTLRKRIDSHEFDLHWQNWAAPRLRDPETEWHSSTADKIATDNIPGVKDSVIDSLIQVQRTEMSLEKRNTICRAIDKRLTEVVPYSLLWQTDHTRLLYWNRYGTPTSVLDKFRDEEVITTYWWFDRQRDAKLQEAMKSKTALTLEPNKIQYAE